MAIKKQIILFFLLTLIFLPKFSFAASSCVYSDTKASISCTINGTDMLLSPSSSSTGGWTDYKGDVGGTHYILSVSKALSSNGNLTVNQLPMGSVSIGNSPAPGSTISNQLQTPPASQETNQTVPGDANASSASSASKSSGSKSASSTGYGGLIMQSSCPSGSKTYKTGLLAGLPCNQPVTSMSVVVNAVKNIINNFLIPIAGVIFILMFIIGGILYITSAGNEVMAKRAKQTLTAAILGFVLVLISYALIQVVVAFFGGSVK